MYLHYRWAHETRLEAIDARLYSESNKRDSKLSRPANRQQKVTNTMAMPTEAKKER